MEEIVVAVTGYVGYGNIINPSILNDLNRQKSGSSAVGLIEVSLRVGER